MNQLNTSKYYYSSGSTQQQWYVIMLSIPHSSVGFTVVKMDNLTEARRIAQQIATAGKLELHDFTITQ